MPWLYLAIASVFEACWIYSLRFLDMKKVTSVKPAVLMQGIDEWRVFLPLAGYIGFGLSNIYFFSLAMKTIPASTAFAVWMALALILSKVTDILVFKEHYNYQQLFFGAVILVGIIGLKYYSKSE